MGRRAMDDRTSDDRLESAPTRRRPWDTPMLRPIAVDDGTETKPVRAAVETYTVGTAGPS
jgi:hypothetical protein